MENGDDYLNTILFSDESSFHLSGKVNRHNVRIWGTVISHKIVERARLTKYKRVLCLILCFFDRAS
jgi:hypothetical protein